jgi:hypothetical protein
VTECLNLGRKMINILPYLTLTSKWNTVGWMTLPNILSLKAQNSTQAASNLFCSTRKFVSLEVSCSYWSKLKYFKNWNNMNRKITERNFIKFLRLSKVGRYDNHKKQYNSL